MLAVESMRRHTADAGWQLQTGLESAGYELWGHGFPPPRDSTDVERILAETNPGTVILQDKREWEGRTARNPDPRMRFHNVESLRDRDDIFKLTVLKDAHNCPSYHAWSADEIGAHGWIIYYHPTIVKHVAPFIRTEHCIRTSHSIDRNAIGPFNRHRRGCVLSGALSAAYPFRWRIMRSRGRLPLDYLKHPGYRARGCVTARYLKTLGWYKVSICTSSRYGYLLRKIIESTACGCIVVTDLPRDDNPPVVERNLVRVPTDITIEDLDQLLRHLCRSYNPKVQQAIADRTKQYYDYRAVGSRLADEIERMRKNHP